MDKKLASQAIDGLGFYKESHEAGNYITEYNMIEAHSIEDMNTSLNRASKQGWTLQGRVRDFSRVINSGATSQRFWCVMTRTAKLVQRKDTSADDILQAIRNRRDGTKIVNEMLTAVEDLPAGEAITVVEELIEDVIAEEPRETALDRFVKNHAKPSKKERKNTRPPMR